jgi:hypothetical protein
LCEHVIDLAHVRKRILPAAASRDIGRSGVIRPLTRLPRTTCPSSPISALRPVTVRCSPDSSSAPGSSSTLRFTWQPDGKVTLNAAVMSRLIAK